MSPVLFTLLIFVPIVGLLGLLWWRFGGQDKRKAAPPLAPENHPSLMRRHYGPAPSVLAALAATPPLAAGNPLFQLMPEEDFRAQEEKDMQAEADRSEAEETELRQAAEQASQEPALPTVAPARPQEVAPTAPQPGATPPATSPTVSVFAALGVDGPAPVAAGLPPAAKAPEDDVVAASLFYNPFSVVAPTKNDQANSLTAAELRRRTREAIKAEAVGNQAALSTLLAKSNPSR